MASKERFSSVTEEELQQIKIDSRAESTVKAIKFWSSLFEDYLREKNIAIDLKTCTADELAAVLKKLCGGEEEGRQFLSENVRAWSSGGHPQVYSGAALLENRLEPFQGQFGLRRGQRCAGRASASLEETGRAQGHGSLSPHFSTGSGEKWGVPPLVDH